MKTLFVGNLEIVLMKISLSSNVLKLSSSKMEGKSPPKVGPGPYGSPKIYTIDCIEWE